MIYDISQPVFGCEVYPGDPEPVREKISSMEKGDLYNLTAFSMCAHNGTHVDAPCHFLKNGKSIDQIPLEKFVGPAFVISHEGEVTGADAARILTMAEAAGAGKKLLLKGNLVVTEEAAEVFAEAKMDLLGNESSSVGPVESPMAVHLLLLRAEVVLLEGIRLANVPDGVYRLTCVPLALSGSDGAPCRAILETL